MIIKMPTQQDIPQMKLLWRQTFGDSIKSIDGFFATGYRQDRCRIVWDEKVLGAVYWFDLSWQGSRYGLIYALAVEKAQRGKGLGGYLVEQVCRQLQKQGYAGAVLAPAGEHLHIFYSRLGFTPFGGADTFLAEASGQPVYLEQVDVQTYLQDRPGFGWDDAFAAFVENQCLLYRAGDMRLIRYKDAADIQEYMGSIEKLPGILAGLGIKQARVRMQGAKMAAGMCRMFDSDGDIPGYLGPILD